MRGGEQRGKVYPFSASFYKALPWPTLAVPTTITWIEGVTAEVREWASCLHANSYRKLPLNKPIYRRQSVGMGVGSNLQGMRKTERDKIIKEGKVCYKFTNEPLK